MIKPRRGPRRLAALVVTVVGAATTVLAGGPASAGEAPVGSVRIVRDEYGVPQVYAATAGALFFGDGYATAQDRLRQADLVRRTATATLFGQRRAERWRAMSSSAATTAAWIG